MSENESDERIDNPETLLVEIREYLRVLIEEIEILKKRVDTIEKHLGYSKE
jgi:hypothetical protein